MARLVNGQWVPDSYGGSSFFGQQTLQPMDVDLMTGLPKTAANPYALAKQPNQLEVLAGQRAKALTTNAGIMAGLGAAQFGLSFVPTAYDRYNRERLDELQGLQDQGRLGLSGAQRQQMEQEVFDPVAAQAHAGRLRQESLQASMGDAASAADVTRAQREEQRNISQAANRAGLQISRANLEEANAQLQEIEERTAYKGERASQRLEQGAQAIGAVAPLVGQIQAANAVKGVDWKNLSPEDRQMAMSLANAGPQQAYWYQSLLAGMPQSGRT